MLSFLGAAGDFHMFIFFIIFIPQIPTVITAEPHYLSSDQLGPLVKFAVYRGIVPPTCICVHIWMFPKIGVPQNGWFIVEKPIKMDELGVCIYIYYLEDHPS